MATGILGGFTTFSAFSLDVANMVERGAISSVFIYIAASVIISLAAVFIGLWFGRSFL
jgi:CrcB protein